MPPDCQNLCPLTEKIKTLDEKVEQYIDRSRETHREMYGRLRELESSDKARDEQYKIINEKLDELISWKQKETEQPKARWNNLVDKLIWSVLAAAVAFVLGRVGL